MYYAFIAFVVVVIMLSIALTPKTSNLARWFYRTRRKIRRFFTLH